jgi:hypothetical protein
MFWRQTLNATDQFATVQAPVAVSVAPPAGRLRQLLAWRPWPRSLASRTLFTLLVGLILVQAAGLTIHAFDRIELQRNAELHNLGLRAMNIYKSVVSTAVAERAASLKEMELGPGVTGHLAFGPPVTPERSPPFVMNPTRALPWALSFPILAGWNCIFPSHRRAPGTRRPSCSPSAS